MKLLYYVCRGETEYVNPYMAEDKDDILARLRRDTTNDRKNKKNYKREVLSIEKLNQAEMCFKSSSGWEISI